MTRMLSRLKKLPISSVNRNIAQANLVAAEKGLNQIACAFAWLRSLLHP